MCQSTDEIPDQKEELEEAIERIHKTLMYKKPALWTLVSMLYIRASELHFITGRLCSLTNMSLFHIHTPLPPPPSGNHHSSLCLWGLF